MVTDWNISGSIAFSLALNYKQMELYHSLPFFCYLLGKACVFAKGKVHTVIMITKLGLSVISIFVLCWLPFYVFGGKEGPLHILSRIFPINRGLFEDKVASFWCSFSVIMKIRNIFSVNVMLRISTLTTLLAVLPSSWNLLRNPTAYRFLLCLVSHFM